MNDMIFNSNLENDPEGALNTGMPITEIMRADECVREVFDPLTDEAINIHPAEEVKEPESDLQLVLGDKVVLEVEVKPWIANVPDFVWETSDPSVIYINPQPQFNGTIEAIAVGEATVTATNPLDNTMKKTWSVSVIAKAPLKPEEPEEGEDKKDPDLDPDSTSLGDVDTTSLLYD